MTQQMTVRKTVFHTARQRTLAVLAAVIAAIALPQLFHMLGAVTGMGTALGQIFLPMHLPVLLVGLLAGPAAGLAAGAVSPLLSYAISGMPVLTGLPFMALELAVYGLIAVCSRIGTCRSLPSCSSHSLQGAPSRRPVLVSRCMRLAIPLSLFHLFGQGSSPDCPDFFCSGVCFRF